MTSTFTDTGREAAIHDYVQRCSPFLLDLTPDQQDQLEDDIRQIVGEVAMELNGQPDDLVGPPLRFVAELRTAAGLPPQLPPVPSAQAHSSNRTTAGPAMVGLLRWTRRTAIPWVLTLLKDLRPAGWVLRGIGLAFVLGALTQGFGHQGIVPNLFGSPTLGILGTIGAVVASVELGRKRLTRRRQGLAVAVASVAAAIALVTAAVGSSDSQISSFDGVTMAEPLVYDEFSGMPTATTVFSQLGDDSSPVDIAPFLNEPTRSTITFFTDTDAPMTEPITTSTQAHEVLNQIRTQGFMIGSVSLAVRSHSTDVAELESGQGKYIFETFDDAHQFVDDFFAAP